MRISERGVLIDVGGSDEGFYVIIPVIDVNGTRNSVLPAVRRSGHIRVREQLQSQPEILEKGIQRDSSDDASTEDKFRLAHIVSDRCRQNVGIYEIRVNIHGSRRVDMRVISNRCSDSRLHYRYGHRHCHSQLRRWVCHNLS